MAIGGQLTSWKHGTHGAVSSLTDFSTKTMDVNIDRDAEQVDATCFQATYRSKEASFRNGNITAQYKYDATVYGQLTAIFNNGDAVDFEFGPDGTTTGKPKTTGSMVLLKIGTPAKVGDLLIIPTTWDTTGAVTDASFS